MRLIVFVERLLCGIIVNGKHPLPLTILTAITLEFRYKRYILFITK